MTRRFSAESAIPVAQALLSPQGLRVGQQQPEFLRWLVHHHWAKQVTLNKVRNRFELTPSGKEYLPEFMASEFGENWLHVSTDSSISRERFLSDHLKPDLPALIHSRVINAVWGEHSKKSVRRPAGIKEQNSELIQLRTSAEMELVFESRTIQCQEEMAFSDAVMLNEKMLASLQVVRCTGPLSLVTIENAGAWQHMPLPPGMVAIYVPGNNQRLFRKILDFFPKAGWGHFGDLDPKGVQIAQTLARASNHKLRLFVPNWWYEYLEHYQLPLKQTDQQYPWAFLPVLLAREYPILNRLKDGDTWLEQEAIMLDGRLEKTLENWLGEHIQL